MGTFKIETGQDFSRSPKSTAIFRRAGGEALIALCGELSTVGIRGIQLPKDSRDDAISPVVELVKKKELGKVLHLLHPSLTSSRQRRIELAKRIPTLTRPHPELVASELDVHQGGKNKLHFLSLRFDWSTSSKVGEERADIWHTLEEISGLEEDDLEWKDYNPDIQLVVARHDVPKTVVDSIAAHIRSRLPMPVELEHAVDPTIPELASI